MAYPRIRITETSPVMVHFEEAPKKVRGLGQIGHVLRDKEIDWIATAKTCRATTAPEEPGLFVEFVAKESPST